MGYAVWELFIIPENFFYSKKSKRREKKEQREKWKASWWDWPTFLSFFLNLPYSPSHVLSPSCHAPQQLVPDGSGGQAAGITQLWKVSSMYGWMDGWSCVYFTIFRGLFLKLDYRQHKRARQPLAYRCLLLLLYNETQKQYGKYQFWLVTPHIKSLLCSQASIFFPPHNTT